VNPDLVEGLALRYSVFRQIRRRRLRPMNIAASGASNWTERPCASGDGPLRERRRAPPTSAGAMSAAASLPGEPTRLSSRFAKRDERLSSRCSCRRSAGGGGETHSREEWLCDPAGFTRSDEDGGDQRTSQRAERAIKHSARARAQHKKNG
jgi:hypothetical protein